MEPLTLPPSIPGPTQPPRPVVHALPETPVEVKQSRVPLWARILTLLATIAGGTLVAPYAAFFAVLALYGWESPGLIEQNDSAAKEILYIVVVGGLVWALLSGPIVLAARWVTTRHRRLATALAVGYPPALVGIIAVLAGWA